MMGGVGRGARDAALAVRCAGIQIAASLSAAEVAAMCEGGLQTAAAADSADTDAPPRTAIRRSASHPRA